MTTMEHTVCFVYQKKRRPYTSKVCHLDEARIYQHLRGWEHTATINPAAWIEHMLNHPEERDRMIEELYYHER